MNKSKKGEEKAETNVDDPLFDKAIKSIRSTRKTLKLMLKELKSNKTDMKRFEEIMAVTNIFMACQLANIESYKNQIEELWLKYYPLDRGKK